MKAFKPDGSRWFAPTALEVMTEWLEQPDLQSWLACSVVLPIDSAPGAASYAARLLSAAFTPETRALFESRALQIAVFGLPLPRWVPPLRVPRLQVLRGRREKVKR